MTGTYILICFLRLFLSFSSDSSVCSELFAELVDGPAPVLKDSEEKIIIIIMNMYLHSVMEKQRMIPRFIVGIIEIHTNMYWKKRNEDLLPGVQKLLGKFEGKMNYLGKSSWGRQLPCPTDCHIPSEQSPPCSYRILEPVARKKIMLIVH